MVCWSSDGWCSVLPELQPLRWNPSKVEVPLSPVRDPHFNFLTSCCLPSSGLETPCSLWAFDPSSTCIHGSNGKSRVLFLSLQRPQVIEVGLLVSLPWTIMENTSCLQKIQMTNTHYSLFILPRGRQKLLQGHQHSFWSSVWQTFKQLSELSVVMRLSSCQQHASPARVVQTNLQPVASSSPHLWLEWWWRWHNDFDARYWRCRTISSLNP